MDQVVCDPDPRSNRRGSAPCDPVCGYNLDVVSEQTESRRGVSTRYPGPLALRNHSLHQGAPHKPRRAGDEDARGLGSIGLQNLRPHALEST
jgi:hypothetical protein